MEEALACLRKCQTPRATLEEPELQVGFEGGDVSTDCSWVNPILRAAEEKLPSSALRTKDSRFASVSMRHLSTIA